MKKTQQSISQTSFPFKNFFLPYINWFTNTMERVLDKNQDDYGILVYDILLFLITLNPNISTRSFDPITKEEYNDIKECYFYLFWWVSVIGFLRNDFNIIYLTQYICVSLYLFFGSDFIQELLEETESLDFLWTILFLLVASPFISVLVTKAYKLIAFSIYFYIRNTLIIIIIIIELALLYYLLKK